MSKSFYSLTRNLFLVMAALGVYTFVDTLVEPWRSGPLPAELRNADAEPVVLPIGPATFAELYRIPYGGMSSLEFDTVCVDMTGKNPDRLRMVFDEYAAEIGRREPAYGIWYARFLRSEAEYSAHCLSPVFPVSYVSAESGESHRVRSFVQCRAETMDAIATEYVAYLKGGGAPVTLAATYKPTGCAGSDSRFAGRIQSVHGALIDAYRAIGLDYPETKPMRVVSTR